MVALICPPSNNESDIRLIQIKNIIILPIPPYTFEYLEKLFTYILKPFDNTIHIITVEKAPGTNSKKQIFLHMDIL